jgi:hypothetical protein
MRRFFREVFVHPADDGIHRFQMRPGDGAIRYTPLSLSYRTSALVSPISWSCGRSHGCSMRPTEPRWSELPVTSPHRLSRCVTRTSCLVLAAVRSQAFLPGLTGDDSRAAATRQALSPRMGPNVVSSHFPEPLPRDGKPWPWEGLPGPQSVRGLALCVGTGFAAG